MSCDTYKKSATFTESQGPDRPSGMREPQVCKKDEVDSAGE